MKKKHLWYWGVFILGLVELGLAFFMFLNTKQFIINKQMVTSLSKKYVDLKYELNEYKEKRYNEMLSSKIKIKNIQLIDYNLDTFKFEDIINQEKLVYIADNNSCYPCVQENINLLKILADSIGTERVILIYKNINNAQLRVLVEDQKIKFNCYRSSQKLDLPMENDTTQYRPFYMMTSKILQVENPLFASSTDSINHPYFSILINYFKRNKAKLECRF
jgi:hypothetical protein